MWYLLSMSVEPNRRVCIEDYLAWERQAETKSEYLDGEVFAMTGASRPHNLITLNVAASLHGQLKGRGCEAYVGDMRVCIPAVNLYTYPDVTVVCGEPRFDDAEMDTLLNPTLVLEVLSPTTEGQYRDKNRGKKFAWSGPWSRSANMSSWLRTRSGWSCSPARKMGTGCSPKPAGSRRPSPSPPSAASFAWRMSTTG